MKIRFLWLALSLLLAPAPLLAQKDAGPDRHEGRRGPVEKLLRSREELGLTDEQVVRLQEINQRMEERNRPYVQRLLEIRKGVRARLDAQPNLDREQRKVLVKQGWEEARPLIERIHENNHAAMREVGAVLTSEQRAILREMIEKEPKRHGGPGDPRRHRDRDD